MIEILQESFSKISLEILLLYGDFIQPIKIE